MANNSNYIKGKKIHLRTGTYTIYTSNNIKAQFVSDGNDVTLNGIINAENSELYFGGIKFNLRSFNISHSKVSFNNCTINYTGTSTLNIILNSDVLFKNCIADNISSYFNITDSNVKMDFSSISRTGSQQLVAAGTGTILFIISKTTILTSNINRNENAVVVFGGYINAPS